MMRALVPLLAAGLALAGAGTASAQALAEAGRAVVAEVVDGDTVVLDRAVEGARAVRLVGVQAPKLALGRPGFEAWPLAPEAKAALARLVLGKRVTLAFGGRRMDRHGRLLAHLFLDDGAWVQGALLTAGLARVYSFADNRARTADMLALEAEARQARRGIWGHPYYAVREAAALARLEDTFQLVEGVIVDAARVKGRVYLNFGADWRSDFTVVLDGAAQKLFAEAGVDPLALEGSAVRVRGWIRSFNGPMIEASHPEQVEVLAR